ncbi:LysE family translocator [Oxalobacteraceae bacterium OM1]|nr:LysE family translocator [Oxalobacteraceae bacterium OM1]
MTVQTWWLFVVMTFFVSATPGPNMLLVMTCSARSGLRPAVAAMAGCMTALLAMMGLSAAGLGALLQAFPTVFDTLRWVGAAYLAYLGVKSWRAPVSDAPADAPQVVSGNVGAMYRQGLLVAASNPKAILFAAAFLPQFIQPSEPKLPQFAILLATFAVIEVSWYLVYALSGRRLSGYLRQAKVLKVFNRLTGGVFVGFGALMAAVRH